MRRKAHFSARERERSRVMVPLMASLAATIFPTLRANRRLLMGTKSSVLFVMGTKSSVLFVLFDLCTLAVELRDGGRHPFGDCSTVYTENGAEMRDSHISHSLRSHFPHAI
eukprot:COSAG01_NODE_19704_length_994_cov_3.526257_1_plen_111_part_00